MKTTEFFAVTKNCWEIRRPLAIYKRSIKVDWILKWNLKIWRNSLKTCKPAQATSMKNLGFFVEISPLFISDWTKFVATQLKGQKLPKYGSPGVYFLYLKKNHFFKDCINSHETGSWSSDVETGIIRRESKQGKRESASSEVKIFILLLFVVKLHLNSFAFPHNPPPCSLSIALLSSPSILFSSNFLLRSFP